MKWHYNSFVSSTLLVALALLLACTGGDGGVAGDGGAPDTTPPASDATPPASDATPPDVTPPVTHQVVINEVYGDHCHTDREFVELLNIGLGAADVSGWTVAVYNNSNGGLLGTYTIPAATMIAPGGLLVLRERTGTDTATDKYMGFEINFDWFSFCPGTDATEVVLLDATGTGIDYVPTNDPTLANRPAGLSSTENVVCASHTLFRTARVDTDTAADFGCGGLGSDTPGAVNAGQ